MHVYLFEAKSIQAYIFKSGKLKDLITASERLDRLIDDAEHSTLNRVLEAAQLKSNLLTPDTNAEADTIGFIRCKGGAFYSYCEQAEPLQALRSLWTLTIQQLFPGLEFADALTQAPTLAEAMDAAHPLLAQARNTPSVKFPLASAICHSDSRTGFAAVPLSRLAKRETKDEELDLDTEHHRQAYHLLKLRKDTLLGKFVGANLENSELPESLSFPLDTEDFYKDLKAADNSRQPIKDLALIHIDGNGLGLLLRALQGALKDKNTAEYSQAFRQFSTALANATQKAAYQATTWLYKNSDHAQESRLLPMRPIVLGGDDITLLCQADLAIGYAETFCHAFKKISEQELKSLHKTHLKGSSIKPYLTASGGILYHKASHPFVTCHELVEGLCQEAKQATKSKDANVGPAALAFYRISNVLAADIATLRQQTQHFKLPTTTLISSLGGYLLEDDKKDGNEAPNSLAKLRRLADAARIKDDYVSIAKFRQMATELARGDSNEAQRIFDRALNLQNEKYPEKARIWLAEPWQTGSGTEKQSWLSDLLIYAHFNKNLTAKDAAHE